MGDDKSSSVVATNKGNGIDVQQYNADGPSCKNK